MLKKMQFSVLSIILVIGTIYSQVPNGNFEQWSNGQPDGWATNNFLGSTVEQTSDAHQGSSAAKGTVISVNSNILPPLLYTGTISNWGFPVSQQYTTLSGYYKLSPVGSDNFTIVVDMLKNGQVVGVGGDQYSAASAYTNFSIPITYAGNDVPDTCWISMTVGNNNGPVNVGTVFYVDDISLGSSPTSVKLGTKPPVFKLSQNYPNPFNPSTQIDYQIPSSSMVSIKVYDLLGREVADLVSERQNAGNHSVNFYASALAGGVYFYRLTAGNYSSVKKLILLK